MLLGNLGNDPEVRTIAGGGKVARFSLATSRTWIDANGVKQEKTEWHKCIAWNQGTQKSADVVENYCKKGKQVYVEGSIEYRQWKDKEGQTRYSTEIKVRELILIGAKSDGARDGGGDESDRPERNSKKEGNSVPPKAKAAEEFAGFPGEAEDEEDDLPF